MGHVLLEAHHPVGDDREERLGHSVVRGFVRWVVGWCGGGGRDEMG